MTVCCEVNCQSDSQVVKWAIDVGAGERIYSEVVGNVDGKLA